MGFGMKIEKKPKLFILKFIYPGGAYLVNSPFWKMV